MTSLSSIVQVLARSPLLILTLTCLLMPTDGFNTCSRSICYRQCWRTGSLGVSKCPTGVLNFSKYSLNEISKPTISGAAMQERKRGRGLFHAHLTDVSRWSNLQMTTTNSSNDVSTGSNNPFVKVWLWFKKLLSKLWNLLKKPFQQIALKDTDTPADNTKGVETVQEGGVLTQGESLAAVEDEIKTELKEQLVFDENKTKKALSEKMIKQQVVKDIPTATLTTSTLSRQATACSTVDLSGNWTLLVDDAFKSQYDDYLRKLGQPMLVRTVALTVISSTKEETKQMNNGQKLFIKGMNVRGSWERTLESSETALTDGKAPHHAVEGHVLKPMTTADEEKVEVASWWEDNGTVHKSWVVGGKKYGGGDFENRRYLTNDGNILVCESIFHPNEAGREKATVTWRFLKEGAMYGEKEFHFPNPFEVFEKKEESTSIAKEIAISKPEVIVGDIMDSVTTSDEASIIADSAADVKQYIDQEGWIPPAGERWALAAPNVDLTGKWKLIITEKFKDDYAEFLKSLGQPAIVIGAAVLLVGNTREETKQTDAGRSLYIRGVNTKGKYSMLQQWNSQQQVVIANEPCYFTYKITGIWERTVIASGSDFNTRMIPQSDGSYNHTKVPILTADAEKVLAESWWEKGGSVHVSWTLGVKKYGGGSFESKRYLQNNGDVYVCESTFHPNDSKTRQKSQLTWRFLREGATVFVGE